MGARSGYVARGGVGTANASIALKLPFWGVGREACKRLLATLPTEALMDVALNAEYWTENNAVYDPDVEIDPQGRLT